ncbi:MAG: flagellar hook-associated protein 3 FlgL [Chthoniobacter sp.]|jgi:flagellar hook-associated protein 3 FlgL|nr:flagellar hook-associated protein 3 FlgL [Chthoniobacter sp.]
MRVTFNSFRDESLTHLNREASNQARLQAQISSGQKISRPDEDPLVAQKILGLQSASAQAQQFHRSASHALDISRSSYAAVDQLRQISDRAGEVASGTSALTTPEAFKAYGAEVDGLIEQAVTAANQQSDGKYLLAGTRTDAQPFTVARDAQGKVTSVTYVGAAQGPAIQVSEVTSVSPYPDGASNSKLGDFINRLVAVRDAMQSNDAAAVTAQRPGLQNSEDALLGTLGSMGAQQHRLEMTQEAASSRYDEASGRISSYNDVDLPQAMVDLTRSQTAYQAALQATAKIMSHSLLDYL